MSEQSHDVLTDIDPTETQEWVDSLAAVMKYSGTERAEYLLQRLVDEASLSGADITIAC